MLAHGGDPTAFGGIDLVGELQATEGAIEPGRFSDLPVDCGFDRATTPTPSASRWRVIALIRAGEPLSAASVEFLLAQQCADGGFRSNMDADGCISDADATAFAAQALIAAGSARPRRGDALDNLAAVQLGDGALESANGVANANTTGLAAQAFAAGGRDAELADAQAFLVSLQYGCSSPAVLRGGIAFSVAKRSTTVPSDQDLRATPQATLGLSGQSLLSVSWSEGATQGPPPRRAPPRPTTTPSTVDPTSSGAPTGGAGGSDPSSRPSRRLERHRLARPDRHRPAAPALLGLLLVVVGGAGRLVASPPSGGARLMRLRRAAGLLASPRRRRRRHGSGRRRARRGGGPGERRGLLGHVGRHRRRRHRQLDQHEVRVG